MVHKVDRAKTTGSTDSASSFNKPSMWYAWLHINYLPNGVSRALPTGGEPVGVDLLDNGKDTAGE